MSQWALSARLTIDSRVRLARLDGTAVTLRGEFALVETKSEYGDSPADRVLADLDAPDVALSKYRVGVDALHRGGLPPAFEGYFVRS